MTDSNPYSPPVAIDDAPPRFRIPCITMFWVSAIFGSLAFFSGVQTGVQNFLAIEDMGGSLPSYIPLLVALTICCSFGFAWSARKWRFRLIRAALIWFVGSLFLFVLGPYVLLAMLYGLPTSLC